MPRSGRCDPAELGSAVADDPFRSAILRSAIFRHNGLWRHTGRTFTTIGASAVVALITLPANGFPRIWLAIAALLATGAVALGLCFFLLRFIDHRA